MLSSAAISNDEAERGEGRSFPRETLKHGVVLVFFGQNNWGKLTNMSKSGMAFEFAKPPSLHEQINFTLQVMGCMPVPRDGSVLRESFEATGEIVWMLEFERLAGVRFVELAERTQEQIRQWLSFEASANTLTSGEEAKPEVPPASTELLAPLTPVSEIQSAADDNRPQSEKMSEPLSEPAQGLKFPFTEEMHEAAVLGDQDEPVEWQRRPESPPNLHPSLARLAFFVLSGCLAALAMTAGIRITMTRTAHRAEVVERIPSAAVGAGESAGAVNVSSLFSSAETAPTFHVEVRNTSGRRWVLWFARNGSKNRENQLASKLMESPSFSASATKAMKQNQAARPKMPPAPRTFTLVAPKVSRPASTGSAASHLSADAPAIQAELTAPTRDLIGSMLPNNPVPAPAEQRVGGMVQEARLIRSVPPVYPALARSTRVSGDVLVDALIDAAGHVTSAKVISGPVLLQQAAIDTVRQWKYEPARLDGQAVAMHLSVTVRFRLN
jgi:TonB family protein